MSTPAAAVRSRVSLPMRFVDGYRTTAAALSFDGLVDGADHLALGLGELAGPHLAASDEPVLVRVHSECLTGDVFGSERCDCGPQLREGVERLAEADGYLLYLRQEGRGIGLAAKLEAYTLQDAGLDTYEANLALGYRADGRDYTVAAQMLHALGATSIVLLSNNPDKQRQLEEHGITVVERRSTHVHLSPANRRYLATKATVGAHTLAGFGPRPTGTESP